MHLPLWVRVPKKSRERKLRDITRRDVTVTISRANRKTRKTDFIIYSRQGLHWKNNMRTYDKES